MYGCLRAPVRDMMVLGPSGIHANHPRWHPKHYELEGFHHHGDKADHAESKQSVGRALQSLGNAPANYCGSCRAF